MGPSWGGKGGGKDSWQKPSWGGKGGGKGWGKRKKGNDPQKTLWVGNVTAGTTYQDLKAHCEQAGACKWAEVYKHKGTGTGAIGFGSAEEAQAAVSMLNGSLLNGMALQVDTWEKQSK